MKKHIPFFLLIFNSIFVFSQGTGTFQGRCYDDKDIVITIAGNNKFSIEIVNKNVSKTNSILFCYGNTTIKNDTVFLLDNINSDSINLVYSEERNFVTITKGFPLIKGIQLMNINNFTEQNYYDSLHISKFKLPVSNDFSEIKIGTYNSYDELFSLEIKTDGNYIYSLGQKKISEGTWQQKKSDLILTDNNCKEKFLFRKISNRELVCDMIYGIIKYTNPTITDKTNHFYLLE